MSTLSSMNDKVSPMVSRIREQLRSRYLSPVVPGTRLPPERELLKHFDVSRPTLRRAISGLVKDGLLRRYPGRGTFVLGPDAQDHFVQPGTASFGIICKSLTTSEGSSWVTGALDKAFGSGVTAQVTISNCDIFRELAMLRQLLEHRVEGILLHPSTTVHASMMLRKQVAEVRQGFDVPIVLLGHSELFPSQSSVWFDDELAAYQATAHLIQMGHKRIAHVGWSGFPDRVKGFRRAMSEAGLAVPDLYFIDIVTVPQADASLEMGRNAGKILLSLAEPPTAVFAYWTEVAAGIILEALSRGLRVPEQMAAIGVGQELSDQAHALLPIQMSTIWTDMKAMGETAMEILLQEVIRKQEPQSIVLPFELRVAASTDH